MRPEERTYMAHREGNPLLGLLPRVHANFGFGASIAASMATAYGCAGTSSGRIRTGVWHLRTKSRVTVYTKSGLLRYILVRNFSTISMVISGRRLISSGA